MVNQQKGSRYIGILLGYDAIIASPEDTSECRYCLTVPQAQALLAFTEYCYWPTRWESLALSEIDREAIVDFADDLRRRLMTCCDETPTIPVLRRVDPDTGSIIQISYDGGTTWITDPKSPALTVTQLSPPVTETSTNTKCDAASNGLQHVKDMVAKQVEENAAGGDIIVLALELTIFILGLILAPEITIAELSFLPLLITGIATVLGLSGTVFADYWTSDVYDLILCNFYCHISEDGSFTDEQYTAVLAQIGSDLEGVERDWLLQILRATGLKGFNNLFAYGSSSEADCSSCACSECVADWEFIPNPSGGSMIVDGDALECTTSDVNTDGKYYILLEKMAGCHTGCGRNNSLQTIVSGGAGQQQAYISKENCDPNDFTFNIDDTCIWRYVIKFNEPTVIRIFFEPCA